MIGLIDRLSRPLMRALDPEDAHALAIKALRFLPLARPALDAPELSVRAFGLNFPNPVGLAAGFDKNAQAPNALLRLGFGFVEVGTVTPRAQTGNPRPRLFRLEADEGVINRLGFNNQGGAAVLARLATRASAGGIVGVNIGANRDSSDRAEDYVRLIETFAPVASYFTVNVSSPNTPGLRDLQQAGALDDLLARVIDARERVRPRAGPTPVLLKIAPDLTLPDLDDVVGIARKHRVDGMIVGNTTISRPGSLRERAKAGEAGGLSGRPLFKLSTRMLAETFVRTESAFPLIGVGGIDSSATAIAKIKAGATLVQLYSGLVYRGIGLVSEIKADLVTALRRGHRASLASMIGSAAAAMTAESWPGLPRRSFKNFHGSNGRRIGSKRPRTVLQSMRDILGSPPMIVVGQSMRGIKNVRTKAYFCSLQSRRGSTIAFINKAKTDLEVDFDKLIAGLQKFLDECFVPVWGSPAKLIKAKKPVAGAWSMVFLDNADTPDALGYHDLTKDGLPLSKIFVEPTLRGGDKVSVTACHELAEMIIDPAINLWSDGPDGSLYAYEMCDAVEESEFLIDGIAMSDFVYPAYFESFRKPNSTQFDYLKKITRPFQILKGGYSIVRNGAEEKQIFGSAAKKKKFAREDRRFHRSEYRSARVRKFEVVGS